MSIQRSIFEHIYKLRERRRSLINQRVVTNLIKHYGGNTGHNMDLGAGNDLGYGLLHYALITNFKPKNVLCIGSGKGFIPAVCALACKENKSGQVDFVDAGFDEDSSSAWGGTGFWKKTDPNEHFGYYDLNRWLTTYVMTSEDFSKMGLKKKWQYIYIDADHSYKGVRKDFDIYWPRLEKGGLMLFHDILLKGKANREEFGVYRLWNDIKADKIGVPFTLPWGLKSGLGIVQKS